VALARRHLRIDQDTRFLSKRQGVLPITPESLEALLCSRGTSIGAAFERLTFFVVDELHAFIDAERGKQLQSLMHRIESVIGRAVPRIGLSATLGDMRLAADFLRPGKGSAVAMLERLTVVLQVAALLPGSASTELVVTEPLPASVPRRSDLTSTVIVAAPPASACLAAPCACPHE
jgi:Lhr-like helicase